MDLEGVEKIQKKAQEAIIKAKSLEELEDARIKHLGRKSELTNFLRGLPKLNEEDKTKLGLLANNIKNELKKGIDSRVSEFKEKELNDLIEKEKIDVTSPGKKVITGHLHPLTQVRRDVDRIFSSMGFHILEGPEIESEWHNFDALNIPRNHPARDLKDTLWIKKDKDPKKSILMRTETSAMQIRYMEKHQPPLRIISPGRVFRNEATDATHEIQFHQIEGLMVGRDISLAHLKGILEYFFSKFFNKKLAVRFTPDYFPFVEPGVGVHLECPKCKKDGCSLCKRTGWFEVAGAGMVHQNVFKAVGYVPKNWQGLAFGMGIERLAMVRYGVDDMRLFFSNDLRFLEQF